MAKEKNNSSKLRNWTCIILGGITLISFPIAGVLALSRMENSVANQEVKLENHEVLQKKELETIVEDADDLKIDGCDPAKDVTGKYDLVEYRLGRIEVQQTEMRKEQKEGFRDIIERLNK